MNSQIQRRRPAFPRLPLDPELDAFEPAEQINLDPELVMKNLGLRVVALLVGHQHDR